MGLQVYRADKGTLQSDGATVWHAEWDFGPSLVKITNCRLATLCGDMRRTVYIVGDPDAWFSTPAKTRLHGVTVTGYVTEDDNGNLVFRHTYY